MSYLFLIHRSSVKLLNLGSGNTDLNVIVSDVRDVRSSAKSLMNAQSTGKFNVNFSYLN